MSHLSVQAELYTVSSNLHYYVQKQVQLMSLLPKNNYIVFLQFLIKGSALIFLFIFISTDYIIKFSIYLCSKFSFGLLWLPFASLIRIFALVRMTCPLHYFGLARVYCNQFR
jgi:hypothetical protein